MSDFAEAYRDFVVYMVRFAQRSTETGSEFVGPDFCDIKARLLLFGESAVVNSVSHVLASHRTVTSDAARREFAEIVKQMRQSIITGHRGAVVRSVEAPHMVATLSRGLCVMLPQIDPVMRHERCSDDESDSYPWIGYHRSSIRRAVCLALASWISPCGMPG